jgi:hypothetical protein
MPDYPTLNKAHWDERAPAHAVSPDYSVDRFVADPHFISQVVGFELPLLGDIRGLRGVHLQCHIGTDTISLAVGRGSAPQTWITVTSVSRPEK